MPSNIFVSGVVLKNRHKITKLVAKLISSLSFGNEKKTKTGKGDRKKQN